MAFRPFGSLASLLVVGSLGCSSAAFDVVDDPTDGAIDEVGDASTEDSSPAEDSSPRDDTASGEDSSLPPDTTSVDSAIDSNALDTAKPDTFVADSAKPDTFVADTFVADTAKPDTSVAVDTAPVDTGCSVGATEGCECGGVRTCLAGGLWGDCAMKCPVAPARYICAYGKNGCLETGCYDSNNCGAKCGCTSGGAGAVCALMDPCWGAVCNGHVCP